MTILSMNADGGKMGAFLQHTDAGRGSLGSMQDSSGLWASREVHDGQHEEDLDAFAMSLTCSTLASSVRPSDRDDRKRTC